MTKEIRAKTFKSGNSVALRLPKALGIKEGVEMKVREDSMGRYVVEPIEALRKQSIQRPLGEEPHGSRPKPLKPEDRGLTVRCAAPVAPARLRDE